MDHGTRDYNYLPCDTAPASADSRCGVEYLSMHHSLHIYIYITAKARIRLYVVFSQSCGM